MKGICTSLTRHFTHYILIQLVTDASEGFMQQTGDKHIDQWNLCLLHATG